MKPDSGIMDFYSYVVFLALFSKNSLSDDNVRARNYDICMTIGKDAFEPLMGNKSPFTGSVGVIFTVVEDASSVELRSDGELVTIKNITLDGVLLEESQYTVDVSEESVTIRHEFLKNTDYNISIIYNSVIPERDTSFILPIAIQQNSVRGEANGTTYFVQAIFIGAQKMLPHFHKFEARSIFNMTVVHPQGYTAIGTTAVISETPLEGNMVESKFAPTPLVKLSSISFIISDILDCEDAQPVNGVHIRVCSSKRVANNRAWAIKYTPTIVSLLDQFMNYSVGMHTNLHKLDVIAVPGQFNFALSFWGVLTFSEDMLLNDIKYGTNRQYSTSTITHEACLQWFGELVTISWAVRESFCKFMQFYIPSQIKDLSDWKYISYMIPIIHEALNEESDKNTEAVLDTSSLTATFQKGGAIFRMIQHVMGHDNFIKSIQEFVMKFAFGSPKISDLWMILQENVDNAISKVPDGVDFASIVSSWFEQPGYPVVKATRVGNDLVISQERFVRYSEDTTTKWYIPISYTTSSNPQNFEKTEPMLWLSPSEESAVVPLDSSDSWVILNNQQTGFYRVMYDDILLDNISKALLQPNFDGITEINRAQIVDDLFAFADNKKTKYAMIFDVLDYLKYEVDFLPWTTALTDFTGILDSFSRHETKLRHRIRLHLICLLEKVYATTPLTNEPVKDDNEYIARNQATIVKWACELGYPACIEDARLIFELWKNKMSLNSHTGWIALCSTVRFSANDSYFKYILDEYVNSDDDHWQEVLISKMTCTEDTTTVKLMLNWTLSGSSMLKSTNHGLQIYRNLILYSAENYAQTQHFFLENIEEILKMYGSNVYSIILNIIERFPDQNNIDQIETWKMIPTDDSLFTYIVEQSLDVARPRLEWFKWHKEDFFNYYDIIPDSRN
ncbi:aminopeptidase N-like isoform X2 [Cylas formicarius]|uniref:aminopeptidase N-like isoform X2 n=1 Tax=Cylas formicarius TaxID=197179 RepID=UPI002958D405|nr:aminopeptidase N-like isoform X2 [Cylas formicarius]